MSIIGSDNEKVLVFGDPSAAADVEAAVAVVAAALAAALGAAVTGFAAVLLSPRESTVADGAVQERVVDPTDHPRQPHKAVVLRSPLVLVVLLYVLGNLVHLLVQLCDPLLHGCPCLVYRELQIVHDLQRARKDGIISISGSLWSFWKRF